MNPRINQRTIGNSMTYLKTIVRFITKNPGAAPGSRDEFSPLRDERPLGSSFMRANPGSEMSVGPWSSVTCTPFGV